MKIVKLGLIGGLTLVLAACPDQQETVPPPTTDPALTETPATAPQAHMVGAQQATLEPVGAGTATGEVHVSPRDNDVEVMLMLRNAPPNESVGARVQSGTCENPGVELARLSAVSTDAMGQGHSQTTVGHAPHLIMDGNHIVTVYAPGTQPERDMPIACATIPQADGTMQPGATGTMPGTTQPGTTRP